MKYVYDRNMSVENPIISDRIVWHNVFEEGFDVYGFDGSNQEFLSRRIPLQIAEAISEGVLRQCGFAAGGRVRFFTNSIFIAIKAEFAAGYHGTCLSACAAYGLDLYKLGEDGRETYLHTYRPMQNEINYSVFQSVLDRNTNPDNDKATLGMYYTLNMPSFSEVKRLYIGLDKDSIIAAGKPYINDKPVIFYGSSITHGAAASRPGNTYEAFISQKYNLDYVNLGFAGNAKGEREMAEYIAGRDMSLFVCDYDYNAPTPEYLQATHYRFYEIIRKRHSEIPYVMMTRPNFRQIPSKNAIRRDIIRESYERAKSLGDDKVYFIDGEELFAGEYCMSCTVDGAHPNDLGFYRMADVVGKYLKVDHISLELVNSHNFSILYSCAKS